MARDCVCGDCAPDSLELHAPQLFCPVSRWWPALTRWTAVGESLFPGWTARKVVKGLRSRAQTTGWQRGIRMGTESLPRGAARAILGAGCSCPQHPRLGQWRASACQFYLDLGREGFRAIASILIRTSDEDKRARHQGRAIGGFKVRRIPKTDRPLAWRQWPVVASIGTGFSWGVSGYLGGESL